MCLSADAVVLVFDQCVLEIAECFFRRLRGAGQHEPQGMEQPHPGLVEFAFCCKAERLSDVPKQHVGPLRVFYRGPESFGDSFFDQTFLQADTQIAGDDLNDVLGFERGHLGEQFAEESRFGGGATSGGDPSKCSLHFSRPGTVVEHRILVVFATAELCSDWTGWGARAQTSFE